MSHEDRILSLSQAAHSLVFIGGQHRSGTTLMRRPLMRHPHIASGPESNLLRDEELSRIREYPRTEWAPGLDPRYKFDPAMVDRVLAGPIDAVVMRYCRARHKQRWAEKTPKNIVYIDTLFALFPTAQFIHMIRDPRNVYCSVREKAARTTRCWVSIRPAESARGWCRRIGCGLSWCDHPDRYREVRYEELVTQPEAVMRSLLTFLGEPWSPGVLEGEAIFSTSVGRWRVDLTAAEIGEIEALAGEVMFDLGYALSTAVRESMRVQPC